jgi:predicted Zn-dependent protease with MMP-like domain
MYRGLAKAQQIRRCTHRSGPRNSITGPSTSLGAIITHLLVHEIGHHFGLSDDDIRAIETSAA